MLDVAFYNQCWMQAIPKDLKPKSLKSRVGLLRDFGQTLLFPASSTPFQ